MKKVILFLVFLWAHSAYCQEPVYTQMKSNYQFRGIRTDSLFLFPKYSDTSNANKSIHGSAIRVKNTIFLRDTLLKKWVAIQGGTTDTTSLSSRINSKADTSSLLGVLHFFDTLTRIATKSDISGPIDTFSLSERINDKIDSLKRISSFIYFKKNGEWLYAFTDSVVYTDTTSLSNRINNKLNISDTANMLSKYLRKADTLSLSNRINLKVNISDTASMLANYAKINLINTKLNISDTANMLNKYLRKIDTASLSSRINNKVDSIKKSSDSIYYWVNGSKFFAYKDSSGGSGSGFVPYTGATQDVDLGNNGLTAKFVKITGTAGSGHLDLKHQSGDATGQANSTKLYANSNGYLKLKNANQYYSTLAMPQTADRVYTYQNKSYTLGDSADISARVKYIDTASMLSPYLRSNTASATYLAKSDSSTYQTKYRTDTMRTNIYSTLNGKVKYTDTATMLSTYLRSNIAAGTYLAKSDSSTYQTKYRSDTSRNNIYNKFGTLGLQQVTDIGNKTNKSIEVYALKITDNVFNNKFGNIYFGDNSFFFGDTIGNPIMDASEGQLQLYKNDETAAQLITNNLTNNRSFYFPDDNGTFALRDDSSIFQSKYQSDTARFNLYNVLSNYIPIKTSIGYSSSPLSYSNDILKTTEATNKGLNFNFSNNVYTIGNDSFATLNLSKYGGPENQGSLLIDIKRGEFGTGSDILNWNAEEGLNIDAQSTVTINAPTLQFNVSGVINNNSEEEQHAGFNYFNNIASFKGIRNNFYYTDANYSIDYNDYFILAATSDNSVTLTLPEAVAGQTYIIKKRNAENDLKINAESGNYFEDGTDQLILTNELQYVQLIADDGGTWYIIGGN